MKFDKHMRFNSGRPAAARILPFAIAALFFGACGSLETSEGEDSGTDGSGVPVSFEAFGKWDEPSSKAVSTGVETRFETGDAMGVTAYYIPEGGSMETSSPNFMYNQKVTCTAQATASTPAFWTYSPVKYWPHQGHLNFYAYFPYTASESGTDKVSWCPLGSYDILFARKDDAVEGEAVKFDFVHMLMRLRVKLHAGKGLEQTILKIVIEGGDADNVLDNKATLDLRTGGFEFSTEGSPSVTLPGSNDYSGYDETVYVKPVSKLKITVVSDRKTYDPVYTDLQGAAAGKTYLLNFSVDGEIVTLDSSNSYILDPSCTETVFDIPVDRASLFWSNNGGSALDENSKWTAEVIWSDHSDIVKFFDGKGGMTDRYSGAGEEPIGVVTRGKSGNALIGLKKEGEQTYLWSWHLWITDYDPSVEGQSVLIDNVRYMDRNLGALTTTPTVPDTPSSQSMFDLYYQFGRKDPFPRYSISGYDNRGANKRATIAESVQEPNVYWFTGDKDQRNWTTDGNVNLWNNPDWWPEEKSFFDPCPPGWRMPVEAEMPSQLDESIFIWDAANACFILKDKGAVYPTTGGHNFSNFDGFYPYHSVEAIHYAGTRTYYWSSSCTTGNNAIYNGLGITDDVLADGSKNRISHVSGARAYGLNARCVKD